MDVRAVSEPADRAVRAFLAAFARLRHDLPAAGVDNMAGLIRQTRMREIPREGKLGNGVEYAVHGVGCRFTTATGVEIDVDIDIDDTPMFDAWRLSNFADSDPDLGEPSVAELTAAAQRLMATGELREVRPGWYTTVS